jgi:membrane protease YdiL (CAAX protease family)
MTATQFLLGTLLAFALGYTVLGYPHKYGALSGRSRLYRTVGLCVLDLLLILVFFGTFADFDSGPDERVARIRYLLYLMSCLTLCLTLPLIAALDALESYSAVRRERREYLNKILEEESERIQRKKSDADVEKRP